MIDSASYPWLVDVVELRGFERLAAHKLTPAAYAYFAGGSGDEWTLRDNEAAFSRRVLRGAGPIDSADVDLSTSMLGRRVAMPVGFAPVALQGLAHEDGELGPARVAARSKIVACVSTLSSQSLESVSAAGGTRWFQLYVLRDRRISEKLIERAVVSGYQAIVLTVDLPVVGVRERELREPLHLKRELGNLTDFPESDFRSGVGEAIDPSLSWKDLEWVRSLSGLPLVLKGILDPVDAAMAIDHGAEAIVVSNHGGRQLDHALATLDALAPIVAAVNGRAEVYLDGGIRSGSDVATAVALGARAAFVGRPYVYASAAGGEIGVGRCLDLLAAQLRQAMALSGAGTVRELTPGMVT